MTLYLPVILTGRDTLGLQLLEKHASLVLVCSYQLEPIGIIHPKHPILHLIEVDAARTA